MVYYDDTFSGIPFNIDSSHIRSNKLGALTSTGYIKSVFRVEELAMRWGDLKGYLENQTTGRNLRKWAGQWLEGAGTNTAKHLDYLNAQILPSDLFSDGKYQVRPMDEVVISATVVCNTASEVEMLLSRRHPNPRISPQRPLFDYSFWAGQFRITHILFGIPSLNDTQTQEWGQRLQTLYPNPTLYCQCERDLKTYSEDQIAYPPRNAVRLILPRTGALNTQTIRRVTDILNGKTLHIAVRGSVTAGTLDAVWIQMPGICSNCTITAVQPLRYKTVVGEVNF